MIELFQINRQLPQTLDVEEQNCIKITPSGAVRGEPNPILHMNTWTYPFIKRRTDCARAFA